jgi:hypothetical protein
MLTIFAVDPAYVKQNLAQYYKICLYIQGGTRAAASPPSWPRSLQKKGSRNAATASPEGVKERLAVRK